MLKAFGYSSMIYAAYFETNPGSFATGRFRIKHLRRFWEQWLQAQGCIQKLLLE